MSHCKIGTVFQCSLDDFVNPLCTLSASQYQLDVLLVTLCSATSSATSGKDVLVLHQPKKTKSFELKKSEELAKPCHSY